MRSAGASGNNRGDDDYEVDIRPWAYYTCCICKHVRVRFIGVFFSLKLCEQTPSKTQRRKNPLCIFVFFFFCPFRVARFVIIYILSVNLLRRAWVYRPATIDNSILEVKIGVVKIFTNVFLNLYNTVCFIVPLTLLTALYENSMKCVI